MHPALATLLYAYGALLPAWALSRLVPGADEPMARWTWAGLIALFGMPLVHYAAAVALGTHLSPALISGVATAVLTGAWLWRRRRAGSDTAR